MNDERARHPYHATTSTDMTKENRKARRKPMQYGARISLDGDTPRRCMLLDISNTGACLEVEAPATIPDRFTLLLSADGKALRKCRVVWRRPHQIGVTFERQREIDAQIEPAQSHSSARA